MLPTSPTPYADAAALVPTYHTGHALSILEAHMYAEALMKEVAWWPISNGYAKSMLLTLASFTDANGRCFPSLPTISERSGFSRSTVIRALHWCVDHGLLVRSEEGRSTTYYFTCLMEDDMTSVSQTPEDNSNLIDITKRRISKKTYGVQQTLVDNMFDAFWSVYPRRIAKGHARLAFRKQAMHTDPVAIVNGAKKYAAFTETQKIDQQYIPHPTTWLNGERWEDDLDLEKRVVKKDNGWGSVFDDL